MSRAFLNCDEAAEALCVSRRSLDYLFVRCPRDPATRALIRGLSPIGRRKRFTVESVEAAKATLKGRAWPASRKERAA